MKRVAIIGCGLIGGSFALGMKERGFTGEIVGYDRPGVLEVARRRGAIDLGTGELGQAIAGADLLYLATPIGVILDLLPRVAALARQGSVIVDCGSTKGEICEIAAKTVPEGVFFVGGHPMVGKEQGGIQNADPELFAGSKYLLVDETAGRVAETAGVGEFVDWLRRLGAEPVWMTPESHDRAVAWLSHLPQLLSTALAATVAEAQDADGVPVSLAGRGFRDMVRLASSPFEVWRDICLTNKENIAQSLSRMEQVLAHLRERLTTGELEQVFEAGGKLVATLRAEEDGNG